MLILLSEEFRISITTLWLVFSFIIHVIKYNQYAHIHEIIFIFQMIRLRMKINHEFLI